MTRPIVRFQLPDGSDSDLGPGALIGRRANAALCLDHPQISEAHAMVSLRGTSLFLLALRGSLIVDGARVPHLRLELGQRIGLVPGVELLVEGLDLPDAVVALEGVAGGPVPLVNSVYSLFDGDPPRLEPGYDPKAAGWLWSADGVRVQLVGESPRALEPGGEVHLGGRHLRAVEMALRDSGVAPTINIERRGPAMRVVARFETLHLHREDGLTFSIGGIPARVVSELVDYSVPAPWELVARSIWPEQRDLYVLRQNWDRHLKRLRQKLDEAGFRSNLVRSDGRGNVELFLMPGDEVSDEG